MYKKQEYKKQCRRKKREKRKTNIVIRGVWKEEETEKEVKEFIGKNIKTEEEIRETRKIKASGGKEIVIAKLENWKDKREMMTRKREFKTGVYIEDDLTWKEREMQRKLRKIAGQKREEVKKVIVKYKGICTDQKWYEWNEVEESLEERKGERNE